MEQIKQIARLFFKGEEKKGRRGQRSCEPVESEGGMRSPHPKQPPGDSTNAPPPNSRRRSSMLGSRRTKYPRERERMVTAEEVVSRRMNERHKRESVRVNRLDELKQNLVLQREEVQGNTSKLIEENSHKRAELEALQAQSDARRAEDELFQMRSKELEGANAAISTHDSIPGEMVRQEVKALNQMISQLASYTTRVSLVRELQRGTADRIKGLLGGEYAGFFKGSDSVVGSNGLVLQAILQIYLARHCVAFISSWHQENVDISRFLDHLYYHITNCEEPLVAGKWREIIFAQHFHGTETEALRKYAAERADEFIEILSYAGWRGEESQGQEIGQAMLDLMKQAEMIRIHSKAGFISADLHPYIAAYGDKFDSSTMHDESKMFGMGVEGDGRHRFVLGSTGIGLRVSGKGRGASLDTKASCRPRVVLVNTPDGYKGRTSRR